MAIGDDHGQKPESNPCKEILRWHWQCSEQIKTFEQFWHVNLWLCSIEDEPLELSDNLGESLQFPENFIINVNQNTLKIWVWVAKL